VTRIVKLLLVSGDGTLQGVLPPFEAELPYWQEMTDVVRLARSRYGVDLTVLRLLSSQRSTPHGGIVTYLAQVDAEVTTPLGPADPAARAVAMSTEPLRAPYATIDGPARSLRWARDVLGPVRADQQRTWNLSAIWRLEGESGVAWLKQVPDFFSHEPVAIGWITREVPGLAPRLVAVGSQGCQLLDDVNGDDLYTADAATRVHIAGLAHQFQVAALDACSTLVSLGVPDRRGAALNHWIRSELAGWTHDRRAVELLAGLDERMDEVAACGVPATLVHGDAHPGNVRGAGDRLVFLDWGDSFVGHPGFDALGLANGLGTKDEHLVLDAWANLWERSVPGSDPRRAVELLRPVAALRSAAVYAAFVARIEPTERAYHRADVPRMLDAAAAGG